MTLKLRRCPSPLSKIDQKFPSLCELNFCCEVNSSLIESLSGLSKLCSIEFEVGINNFSSDHFISLVALTSVKCLNITSIEGSKAMKDNVPAYLRQITSLTSLQFRECDHFTHEGLAAVVSLPSLSSLIINECRVINDRSLRELSKATGLTKLNLMCCHEITNSGLSCLSNLDSLTSLNLSTCMQITSSRLGVLFKSLIRLVDLTLAECPGLTDDCLSSFATLTSLTSLDLGGCENINGIGLGALSSLPALSTLILSGCNVTNEALVELSSSKSLCLVDLSHNYGIRCQSLALIAELCSANKLKSLAL